ncbi:MAG: energy-coupling factor transporter transmembrane protein EcfT [Firmicutes bacterium]|nr:energy-coupling factor transporter transmembrane protein EcfT [Bacillota bacterium]
MRDVSFGQYYPVKSVVHRCDPRVKLLIAIGYIVMLFFIPTISRYQERGGTVNGYLLTAGISYVAILLFILTAIFLSRVPLLKVLKSVRAILFIVVFMTIISMLFYAAAEDMPSIILAKWWIFTISVEGIINAVAMTLRIVFLVLGPALLTLTTTPVELTDGLESLLTPLKWIRLPVHEFAIIMSIALRLIPTLIEETGKIMNAQKARCADFDSRNLFKKAKALMPVLIPLFVSSFRRADELADAMDSRCYRGAKERTRMKKLRFGLRDVFCFLAFAAVFFGILMIRYEWFGVTGMVLGVFF